MKYVVTAENAKLKLNETDRVKSILQNIGIILRTREGTVPLYREFGLPMNFLDRPMATALPAMVIEIREAVAKFEPRAELLEVKAVPGVRNDNTETMRLAVEVEIPDE